MTPSLAGETARWGPLQFSRVLGLALVLLLVFPAGSQARPVGLVAGDTLTYLISQGLTYSTPNGNHTKSTTATQTITVETVYPNAVIPEVRYSTYISDYNGSAIESPTTITNFTAIFDPYINLTYTGNIGFWPFIFTDVKAGPISSLAINYSVNGVPGDNGTISYSSVQLVDAVVTRPQGLINISMFFLDNSSGLANMTKPVSFQLEYNATTGVLQHWREKANFYSIVENFFDYDLVSFHRNTPPNLWYIPYIILGAIIVVVGYEAISRKSPKQRKVSKIREKYTKGR